MRRIFPVVVCVAILALVGVAQSTPPSVADEVIAVTKAQWAAEMQKNTAEAMKNASSANIVADIGAMRFQTDDAIAKLSLVGAGMKSNPGVAADMFDALAAEGINIEMISTSSIRISCIIRSADAERALQTIHRRFGLEGAPMTEEP